MVTVVCSTTNQAYETTIVQCVEIIANQNLRNNRLGSNKVCNQDPGFLAGTLLDSIDGVSALKRLAKPVVSPGKIRHCCASFLMEPG